MEIEIRMKKRRNREEEKEKARKKQRKEPGGKKGQSRKRLTRRGSTVKEALKKGRVLSNVDKKHFGHPASRGLYDVGRETVFGERCSTPSPHGLTCDVIGKEKA